MGLTHPIATKIVQKCGTKNFKAGSVEMQGCRNSMEDQHIMAFNLPKHPQLSFFGVFDGHNGDSAAKYTKKYLFQRIDELKDPHSAQELQNLMCRFDTEFIESTEKSHSGCTCVFAVVETLSDDKFKITVANIGDSRCLILSSSGDLIFVTTDHCPGLESEKTRIEKAGGFVQFNRVDGQLAMSRALGDVSFKTQTSIPQTNQKVIPVPDVSQFVVNRGDLLFLACDGIFEKMSSDTVKNFIFTQYKTKADLTSILCDLLDLSLDAGSQDNMTALLVYLGENGENYTIAESERILPGPFFPQCSQESFAKQYVSNLFSIYDGKIPSSAIKAMCEASKKSLHQKILKLNQELEDIRKDAEIQKQFLFEQIEKGFPEGATKPEGRIFSRPRVDSRTIIKFESPTFKAASMFVPLDKLSPVEFVVSETKHGYCIALIEGNLPEEGEVHLSSSFVASTLTSEIDKLPTLTKESLASSVEKIDQALKRQIIGDQPSDNKNSSSRTPSGVPNCFIQDFCSMSFAVISKLNSEEEPKQFPLICGHVGFTHCLLGKGSKVGNVHLLVNTKTHSPFDNEERDRLIQSGVEPKIFRQAFTGEVLPARRLGISRQQGVIPKPTVTDNVHAEPGDFLLFLTGSLELGPIERLTEFIQQRLVVRKGDLEATLEDALYYATQRTSRFYSSFSIMIFQILPQSQSPPSNLQIQKIYRPGPIFFLEGSPELKKVYVQHAELHGRKLDMDLMKEGYLADIRNIEREVETAAELTAQKIDEINANIQRIENGECEKTFHFWLEQLTKK